MLKSLELAGFKSFAKKTVLDFEGKVTAVVGPNGAGKSNVVEAIRFVLGEQSMKSMRGKSGSDLIFKGSKNLSKLSRAYVTIIFDNRRKKFIIPSAGANINLDFDEIAITREVLVDGSNKYSINGTEVRLKDIIEMLSSVNIGSSGHHIISQGEADRILNSSLKERRAMVEDALGLKIYQYRIRESERKLERTRENMKEVGLLRKEIVPHLHFLKRQVEKIEKAKEMRAELGLLYDEYLKKEELYLEGEKARLRPAKKSLEEKLRQIEGDLAELKSPEKVAENLSHAELLEKERKISELRSQKDELSRKLGRMEGILELKESKAKLSGMCPVCGGMFVKREEDEQELVELRKNKEQIFADLSGLVQEETELLSQIEVLKKEVEVEKDKERVGDVKRLEFQMEKNKLLSELNLVKIEEDQLAHIETDFLNEIKEGHVLVGSQIMSYKSGSDLFPPEDRSAQEERRRKIERLKIRLEDAGLGGGAEVTKEYEEVTARDQFLARELEDLEKSMGSLEQLVRDLKTQLETNFREGIEKINKQFQEFFALMFGGGTATLEVVVETKKKLAKGDLDMEEGNLEELREEEDEETEYGIDINISLPHKKVKELHALSGGERSLTSIALLFAMSQVNPPPFLVLDETDAALDEANSRKYGDMLEKLSQYSQLIVVTHNRETMSRAGILYGITIGSDGASKLLSIKFDEALAIAK